MSSRRDFVKKSISGLLAGSALGVTGISPVLAKGKKEDLFKLGVAGYSFVHFKLDEALAMMKKTDVHYL